MYVKNKNEKISIINLYIYFLNVDNIAQVSTYLIPYQTNG